MAQARTDGTQRTRRKKRGPNLLPFLTALLVLFAVCGIGVLLHAYATAERADGYGAAGRIVDEPEFFSTMKPIPVENPSLTVGVKSAEEFEDTVVVGDELTAQLEAYVAQSGHALRRARFMTASGYSWSVVNNEPLGGDLYLTLDGRYVSLIEALLRTDAKRLYIQLGMRDIREVDPYYAADQAQTVLSALAASRPALQITVMPVTPLIGNIAYDGLSNESIALYNSAVRSYCESAPNCSFLDINSIFPGGELPLEYCADPETLCILWNSDACAMWASMIDGSYAAETEDPEPTEPPQDGTEPGEADGGDAGEDDGAPPENGEDTA